MAVQSYHTEGHADLWLSFFDIARDRVASGVGIVLCFFVALFCAIHGILKALIPDGSTGTDLIARLYGTFSIVAEGSVAEKFNHGQSFAAAILFLAAAISARSWLCLLLAVLMALAWFDDSAGYHERFAEAYAAYFNTPYIFKLDSFSQGEILAWVSIGVILIPFAIAAWIGRLPGDRIVLGLVAFPIVLLVFCASVMDMLHSLHPHFAGGLLMYLEDGGEMIAISMLVAVALYLTRNIEQLFHHA